MTTAPSPKELAAPWYYSSALLPLYVSWRIFWANRLPITDCDEVYNYWEPLHYVLYGSGLQTWEYAHEYALRTFTYILPLKYVVLYVWKPLIPLVAPLFPLLTDTPVATDKVACFVLLRCTLGAVTAICELLFLNSLTSYLRRSAVRWAALAMLFACGMNHSAAAYLPSSSWMQAWMLAATFFLSNRHYLFIVVAVTATLTTAWPFGVVVMLPMGLAILWREYQQQRLISTLTFTVLVTSVVQSGTMLVDKAYYGVWLSPTWNIFVYNAAGGGDALYGEEPASFYVKNLLLNLNLVAPLGLLGLPTCILCRRKLKNNSVLIVLLSPLLLWLAVTVPRPHKEERFLFPIYPLLVVGAAMTMDFLVSDELGGLMASFTRHKRLSIRQHFLIHSLVWVPVILLSISRTVALSKYYSAPLQVYAHLAEQQIDSPDSTLLVCTCGEWYRFPSSFYLPSGAQLGFLPSSFKGQLPQPFSTHGSLPASQAVLQPFNDRNEHIEERYVSVSDCTWIIDFEGSECGQTLSKKKQIAVGTFLDTDQTSATHRVLYIPFLHEKAIDEGSVAYRKFTLFGVLA